MAQPSQWEIVPVVRCIVCRFDVAEVDERGWCRRCSRTVRKALGE